MPALFAFLHHAAAFALFAALAVEFVLMKGTLTVESARKIQLADTVYGAAAGTLMLAGFARVFHFEKGAHYYFHTWTFDAKLALFVIVGLLSILPTMEFRRWRPAVSAGQAPSVSPAQVKRIRSLLHFQLTGVGLILLFAALMAKGVGYIR